MASIIDSFRETYTDRLSIFKILVFAIPIYFSYDFFLKGTGYQNAFIWLSSITAFFLFGFFIKVTSGVLNESDSVLPPLNPFKFAFSAIKGILAMGPVIVACFFLGKYLSGLVNFEIIINIILNSVIWILMLSICMTSFLMFVRREHIFDTYNLKTLSNKTADLMVALIFFVIQLVIVNLLTTVFIGYVIFVLFGIGSILYFFISLAIVYNVGVIGHYLAQLQYEVLGYDRENL